MKDEIGLRASKVKRKKKIIKVTKLVLLISVLVLLVLYLVASIIYNNGTFSINLDKNLYLERGIIVYDDPEYKEFRTELYAKAVERFDNISYKWLPDDLDKHEGGSHNGDNYVAYTFYIENQGKETTDYWSEMVIDDVIKNVDEVVRVKVYKNGVATTYAKPGIDGKPEKDTVAFKSDNVIALDHVENFKPGDLHKYTVVIWVEGSDLECTDNILGGQIKIYMDFNSEFIDGEQEDGE